MERVRSNAKRYVMVAVSAGVLGLAAPIHLFSFVCVGVSAVREGASGR
jgi:hypothetical protein